MIVLSQIQDFRDHMKVCRNMQTADHLATQRNDVINVMFNLHASTDPRRRLVEHNKLCAKNPWRFSLGKRGTTQLCIRIFAAGAGLPESLGGRPVKMPFRYPALFVISPLSFFVALIPGFCVRNAAFLASRARTPMPHRAMKISNRLYELATAAALPTHFTPSWVRAKWLPSARGLNSPPQQQPTSRDFQYSPSGA